MTFINPTAPRRPAGTATALLCSLLAAAATTASGAAPFTCPGGATCKNWNDGCNECNAGDDGIEACTEMYCVCIEDGSCPAPRCLDVEGCKPIEGDPKQISIGGDLKAEDDFIVCATVWMPVCGSDGRVYSNACEAGAAGQEVEYEISPDASVTAGKDCPPEKPAAEISIGGNLKEEDDGIVCMAIWQPVCGSDGRVYSNACEAGAKGQEVEYEISPDASVTAGDDCPPEKPSVTVTMESCGSMKGCVDCLEGGCTWAAGECMTDCLVADVPCYTPGGLQYAGSVAEARQADKTPAQVCLAEAEANADAAACDLKSCGECVSTVLPSDKTKTCRWFGSDGGFCGSACGLAGCGETECPLQVESGEDPIVCTKEWKPVCGSDDKVHSNACMAEAAGQEVQYEIESPDSVTAGKDCPPKSVDPQGGGDEDLIACDAEWKPVCGSDDKVYSNACTAKAEGQEVQYEIESPDDSVTAGKDCPPESPTKAAPEGEEDGIVCTTEWKPVCGSDAKVYSNACEAGAAGQEVQFEIESPDDSVTAGKDCPPESPAKTAPEEEEDPLEDEDDSAGDRVKTWHLGLLLTLHLAAVMLL